MHVVEVQFSDCDLHCPVYMFTSHKKDARVIWINKNQNTYNVGLYK